MKSQVSDVFHCLSLSGKQWVVQQAPLQELRPELRKLKIQYFSMKRLLLRPMLLRLALGLDLLDGRMSGLGNQVT